MEKICPLVDEEKICPLVGETRTQVTGVEWPCSTSLGTAASVFQTMMNKSLEADTTSPAAVAQTPLTSPVWLPESVRVHVAEAPSADSVGTVHTRSQ